jgi:uncharacterized protein YpuA (DUF1002 family)
MARLEIENGYPVIVDKWDDDDIRSVAEDMDIELTDDQVLSVMQLIVKAHDANIGINWDAIGSAIDTILESKGDKNA